MRAHRCVIGIQAMVLVIITLAQSVACGGTVQSPPARIAVWDTGSSSSDPLSPTAFSDKNGWEQVPRNQTASSFHGDAVITNGRILAVLRKRGATVEVYSTGSKGPVSRVRLQLQSNSGDPAIRLDNVALVENTRSAARLEVTYLTAGGDTITTRFRIKRGEIWLEAEPGPGAGRLRVESPGRYVVLPDFFADDILIDATKIPVPVVEVPSENFLLHLTGAGEAIAMCVFENREQDVKVMLSEKDGQRIVTGSEIHFGKEQKIWLALMEAHQIWHALEIRGEDAKQIMPLDWTRPFAGQWRVDFTRGNGLTDSWEMLLPDKDGEGYIRPTWLPSGPQGGQPSRTASGEIDVDAYKVGGPASNRLGPDRKRWITVLGWYEYPCWLDATGNGFLQPLKHKAMTFQGPAVVYPINRLTETPIDTYTTVDVVRGTLGVGPCEYILSVEGQRQDHVGRATCHVRRLLNEIYQSGQQKTKQKEIETYLGDALDFVEHIRVRIEQYIAFGDEVRQYLAEQKKARPELEAMLTELDKIAAELDERLAARQEKMKSPEFVVQLNEEFRKNLLDYDDPDALKRLKEYTDALTSVGGSQDGMVGECRWIVRTLRQRAGLMMAIDPRCAEVAEEIRVRTQKVLLKPSAYEGARH
ncbi:MAG: hypothetical protein H8E44_09100 [Planctomycetes bacterium]|nr:hypothetical protein [Planctomycetota bacterium]MBL7042957.1 hypothetical protein [Pirellulaceae bacterium]